MTEANDSTADPLKELELLASMHKPESFGFSQESFPISPHPLYTGWYKFEPRLDSCLTLSYQFTKQTQNIKAKPTSVRYVQGTRHHSHKIEFLPPVTLKFILPIEYPNSKIPRFAFICSWLPPSRNMKLSETLCEYALTCQGEPQLLTCFDYIETTLQSLLELPLTDEGLLFNADDIFTSKIQLVEAVVEILKYQQVRKDQLFDESFQECSVCFEGGLGRGLTQVRACGHVFCKRCLRYSLKMHLESGPMNGTLSCMACKKGLDILDVKRFATKAQFSLYDELLFQKSLNAMHDVVNCPRRGCGNLVWIEDKNLAMCAICYHSFCPLCLRTYHVGSACKQPDSIYGDGDDEDAEDEDDETKDEKGDFLWEIFHCLDAERRKILIERQIKRIEAGDFEWRSHKSATDFGFQKCPNCGIFIEKNGGCSSMYCRFCETPFIWGR